MKEIHTEVVVKKDVTKKITGYSVKINGVELPCTKSIIVNKVDNKLPTITVTMVVFDAPGIKFDVEL